VVEGVDSVVDDDDAVIVPPGVPGREFDEV
jgi:hypothetical protein